MTTEILGLDEIAENQSGKHITHNEALRQLEGRSVRVISKTNGGPPGAAANGDTYIVDVANGVWASASVNDIAQYYGGAWHFWTPVKSGYTLFVHDSKTTVVWSGSTWKTMADIDPSLASGRLSILDRDLTTPPGGPVDGDAYIVASPAAGAWAGKEDYVARWDNDAGVWIFYQPSKGWFAYVEDEDIYISYIGTEWRHALDIVDSIISNSTDIVDVFIYDTTKDSDGGAWRKRCQDKSWYKEDLNTATRGATREFPAVALIVAEQDRVVIYDATDPDVPMWMVFNSGSSTTWLDESDGTHPVSSVNAINGYLYISKSTNEAWRNGLLVVSFLADKAHKYTAVATSYSGDSKGNIASRNSEGRTWDNQGELIAHTAVHDIAVTVLDDAPIDQATGLPIPTVAAATDGNGTSLISIITPTGGIYDVCPDDGYSAISVDFYDSSLCVTRSDGSVYLWDDVAAIKADGIAHSAACLITQTSGPKVLGLANKVVHRNIGSPSGLTRVLYNQSSPADTLLAYLTSQYNTGWLHGDNRLAALADTTAETIGVDETTELVTNGTFNTDVSGWTVVDGTIVYDTGRIKITSNGGIGNARAGEYAGISVLAGKVYKFEADIEVGTSGTIYLRVASNNYLYSNIKQVSRTTDGHLELEYSPTVDETVYVAIVGSTVNGEYCFADNVSVKQTGNLVVNGHFTHNTIGWTDSSTGTASISHDNANNRLDLNGVDSSNVAKADTSFVTEIGKRYVVTGYGNNNAIIRVGTTQGGSDLISSNLNTTTTVFSFVATSSTTWIRLEKSAAAYVDEISVRLAEEDRSVKANHLEVHGQITKSPVATGAELVWSYLSAGRYYELSDPTDIEVGTDDFYMIAWAEKTLDQNGALIKYGTKDGSGNYIQIWYDATKNSIVVSGHAGSLNGTYQDILNKGAFLVIFQRRNGNAELWINDTLQGSIANAVDFTQADAVIHIGRKTDITNTDWLDNACLVRMGAGSLSPEQIAFMYEQEKKLFEENAACTLAGSSDSVVDLAYDEAQDQLHVLTGTHRSVFNGLVRTDSEASPLGTLVAVDAAKGTVLQAGTTGADVFVPAKTLREELELVRSGLHKDLVQWNTNLVKNGKFNADAEWTKGAGWSISGGVLTASSTSTNSYQETNIDLGINVIVQFTLSNIAAGTITPYMGTDAGTARSTDGTYVESLTSSGSNPGRVYLQGGASLIGDIDDVSVRLETPILPTGYKPFAVYRDGQLIREGQYEDYQVNFDGFNYSVTFTDNTIPGEVVIMMEKI